MRDKLLATAAAAALLMGAGSAQALDVSIGLGFNTPTATTIAGPGNGTVSYDADPNATTAIDFSAKGTVTPADLGSLPAPDLISSLISITEICNVCQVNLFVTEQGLMFPTPSANYNLLNVDWLSQFGDITTSQFTFWASAANGLYTGTSLGTYGPTVPSESDVELPNFVMDTGIGPFSESEEFTLNFGNCSVVACTADLSMEMDAVAVPEPASLSLLGGSLLAFGAWRRRRNQKA
jgi:hypothetical protein